MGAALQRMAAVSAQMGADAGATVGGFGRDLGDTFDFAAVSQIADIHRPRFDARPDVLGLVDAIDDYQGSGVLERR